MSARVFSYFCRCYYLNVINQMMTIDEMEDLLWVKNGWFGLAFDYSF